MKSILHEIVQQKKKEVIALKKAQPLAQLFKSDKLNSSTLSMKSALVSGSGIIAEFKRASPSKGIIRAGASVQKITSAYEKSGASAVSVLTDSVFFKANSNDLKEARQSIHLPILRKEFIIDEYQIYQSKIMGADCILLIAAILTRKEISYFIDVASNIGLEAIIEVHNEQELDKLSGKEQLVGVNNRNLDTFEVSISTSLRLASELDSVVKITESGLSENIDFSALIRAGYLGFLVGESFMKSNNPGLACKTFVQLINKARHDC